MNHPDGTEVFTGRADQVAARELEMILAEDLVGSTEIAQRFGVGLSTISQWRARYDDFPQPILSLAMGNAWRWDDVKAWHARDRAKITSRMVTLDEIAAAFESMGIDYFYDDTLERCGFHGCGASKDSFMHGPVELCAESPDALAGRHRDDEHHAYMSRRAALQARFSGKEIA